MPDDDGVVVRVVRSPGFYRGSPRRYPPKGKGDASRTSTEVVSLHPRSTRAAALGWPLFSHLPRNRSLPRRRVRSIVPERLLAQTGGNSP